MQEIMSTTNDLIRGKRGTKKEVKNLKTQLEKAIYERSETNNDVGFALGGFFTCGNLTNILRGSSSLSDASFNTVMTICRYLGCSPEELMEQNEFNGTYEHIRNLKGFCKIIKAQSQKIGNEWFRFFYTRNQLTFSWILEDENFTMLRLGRFEVKNNQIGKGIAFEAKYTNTENIARMRVDFLGVSILPPVLFKEAKNDPKRQVGVSDLTPVLDTENELGVLDSTPVLDHRDLENDTCSSDRGLGINRGSENDSCHDKSFTFNYGIDKNDLEGIIDSHITKLPGFPKHCHLFKSDKTFDRLPPRQLVYIPNSEIFEGDLMDVLKEIYSTGFKDAARLDYMSFIRSINSIISPFRNRIMKKELKDKDLD